jgi:hypothetical protein
VCGPLDAHESVGAGLSCRGSSLAIAANPAGNVDSCCGEVILVDWSRRSNCRVQAVLAVPSGAARSLDGCLSYVQW